MTTTMKPIKDYEGLYSITPKGDILGHIQDDYLKHGTTPSGFRVRLCKHGVHSSRSVAQLIVDTFIGDNLKIIGYHDGNQYNIAISNIITADAVLTDKQLIKIYKSNMEDMKYKILKLDNELKRYHKIASDLNINNIKLQDEINSRDRQIETFEGTVRVLKLKHKYDIMKKNTEY